MSRSIWHRGVGQWVQCHVVNESMESMGSDSIDQEEVRAKRAEEADGMWKERNKNPAASNPDRFGGYFAAALAGIAFAT